jgi:hypothetical protein
MSTIKVDSFLRIPFVCLLAAWIGAAAQAQDPLLAQPPPMPLTAADSNAVPDTAPDAPAFEAVKLSTQGAFTSASPRVGDSLDYVLRVEWEDTQVPVVVLAPDSLVFTGFKVLGQATVHKKLAAGNQVRNLTEFIFRLRAQTQGPGKASSLRLRYVTGISNREEAAFIPTVHIDILPAPVRILDTLWFKLLAGLLILGGGGALARYGYKKARQARAEKTPRREDLRPAVDILKSRLRAAQSTPDASREILLEMESLALRFLQDELGDKAASARFEPLLDRYLAREGSASGGPRNGGDAEDWARLRELFRHARFAGGYKEPHELQEAFRTLKKCIKITGEDQHD